MGEKAVYLGTSDEQVRWGGNADPRGILVEGKKYEVEDEDVRSWHTKLKLVGIDGWFNDASFRRDWKILRGAVERIKIERERAPNENTESDGAQQDT